MRVLRVLIAPDKFKGSLTAAQAAAHIAAGVRVIAPGAQITTVPVADGGEGTLDAALAAGFEPVHVHVAGPTGEVGPASYARRADTAVVELAGVCGIPRLPAGQLEPMHASSRGVGEVVGAALDAGARRIVLGIGGSASTDGGAGLLQALGAAVLDERGTEIVPGGAGLADVAEVRLDRLHSRLHGAELIVASDVTNPLYGSSGAAAVYGPQKGADPEQVAALDAGLRRWADVAAAATGRECSGTPGAGAAGGVGFAALLLGATLRPGIEVVLDLLEFEQQLAGAHLVITGEGSLDGQTLSGKAPAGVAAAATRAGVPVLAVAGRLALDRAALAAAGFSGGYALQDLEPDLSRSLRDAGPLLERTAAILARDWLGAG